MNLISLIYKEKWSEVTDRIQSHPEETKSWDKFRDLPLHYAVGRNNIPAQVIEQLIEAHPTAVKERADFFESLPIHIAVRDVSSTTCDIVKVLLRYYIDGATVTNSHGHTPLLSHLVLCESLSMDVVKLLVEAHPDVAKTPDRMQYYPLHRAVECGHWEISKCLIDAFPEALQKETGAFEFPCDTAKRCHHYDLWEQLQHEEVKIFGSNVKVSHPINTTSDQSDVVVHDGQDIDGNEHTDKSDTVRIDTQEKQIFIKELDAINDSIDALSLGSLSLGSLPSDSKP